MPFRFLSTLLLACLAVPAAYADVVAIYEADAPILSLDARDREQAVRNAFRRVLVKASGDTTIASAPEVDSLLAAASTHVLGEEARQVITTNALGQPEPRQVLRVRFDPEVIRRTLGELGRPLWPEQRPAMMVWLVVDDGTRKQVASSAQVQALGALTQRADERGLRIQLPAMDGVDQGRVDGVTLWDAPLKTVVGASGRYNIQVSLLIRLRRAGTEWSARYALIQGAQFEEWSGVDTSSAPLLALGIDGAADRLARRYAFDDSEPPMGVVSLWLTDVRDGVAYGRALAYLRQLDAVRQLQVIGAEGDRAWLSMEVRTGPRRFRQLLKYDAQLELLEVATEPGQPPAYALQMLY